MTSALAEAVRLSISRKTAEMLRESDELESVADRNGVAGEDLIAMGWHEGAPMVTFDRFEVMQFASGSTPRSDTQLRIARAQAICQGDLDALLNQAYRWGVYRMHQRLDAAREILEDVWRAQARVVRGEKVNPRGADQTLAQFVRLRARRMPRAEEAAVGDLFGELGETFGGLEHLPETTVARARAEYERGIKLDNPETQIHWQRMRAVASAMLNAARNQTDEALSRALDRIRVELWPVVDQRYVSVSPAAGSVRHDLLVADELLLHFQVERIRNSRNAAARDIAESGDARHAPVRALEELLIFYNSIVEATRGRRNQPVDFIDFVSACCDQADSDRVEGALLFRRELKELVPEEVWVQWLDNELGLGGDLASGRLGIPGTTHRNGWSGMAAQI